MEKEPEQETSHDEPKAENEGPENLGKSQRSVVGLAPVFDDEGKVISYRVRYDDGAEIVVPPGDPVLSQQLPFQQFFVRRVDRPDVGGNRAVVELSPLEGDSNRIQVTIPTHTESGEIDPRFSPLLDAVERQRLDFLQITLSKDLATGEHRIISVGEPCPKNFKSYKDPKTDQWVKTDSDVRYEFAYKSAVQDQCDIHGQWRVAESHLETLADLHHPEEFDRLQLQTQRKLSQQFVEELVRQELQQYGPDVTPEQEKVARHKVKSHPELLAFNDYLEQEGTLPVDIGELLEGNELELVDGELKATKTIYDLDRPLNEQVTLPEGLSEDEQRASLFSQRVNYGFQRQLRERFITNAKANRVFLNANLELVQEDIIPFADPYRSDQDMLTLNQEFSEMIGSDIIAAYMKVSGAKPNQAMRSLGPNSGSQQLLDGLPLTVIDPETEVERVIRHDELLAQMYAKVGKTIQTHKHNIIDVVEVEAYKPGMSPKARKEAKLDKLKEDLSNRGAAGALAASGVASAVEDIEGGVSFFR